MLSLTPSLSAATPMTIIGLMSGTSVDSVDACCVRLTVENGKMRHRILHTHTRDFPEALRTRLMAAMSHAPIPLVELMTLNVEVGRLFGETVNELLEQAGLMKSSVDAIGSHGQTLFHLPPDNAGGLPGSTLQIGEPSVIAELTGIRTVADFRPRDMAAGGHGAPLVCFADKLLFGDSEKGRAIQNIGGIGNVTVLSPYGEPFAFDTGPGNMLIDAAMQSLFNQPYDADGKIAASGQAHPEIIAGLMSHPYFKQAPPKTTGRELFGLPLWKHLQERYPAVSPADWVATLTAFTVETIAAGYRDFVFPQASVTELVVGGGGVYNPTLMGQLSQRLTALNSQLVVKTHADFGIPDKYKEALAFAILAWATLNGVPNNVPSCTGARHSVVLGKIISA